MFLGKTNQAKEINKKYTHSDLQHRGSYSAVFLIAAEVAQQQEVRSFTCHAVSKCQAGFPGSINKVQTDKDKTGMFGISVFIVAVFYCLETSSATVN